jgi:hypothetical protein
MKTTYTIKNLFRILLVFGVLWAAGGAYSAKPPVVEPISVEPTFDEPTATCNNPNTIFRNNSTVTVTILKFMYKSAGCGDKWRTELTRDVTVPPGFQVTYHDDLGGVEGCALISFKFKYRLGVNTRWSDALTPNEGIHHICVDGGTTYTNEFDDSDL